MSRADGAEQAGARRRVLEGDAAALEGLKADNMAKQNPASDPVSQAMLAIEDALNLSSEGETAAPAAVASAAAAAAPPEAAALKAPATKPAEPVLPRASAPPPPQARAAREARTPLPGEPPPANDDRASVRPIVQALQVRQPSRASYVAATVLSLLWFGACCAYAYSKFAGEPWRDSLLSPGAALLALGAIGPILVVYAFAAFARRLYELRLSAASIAQVAMRLAEPESTASENFVTLSQAIRRELETLGVGVEKAYSRANELDGLVRSEVTAIERASGESERRIRSLIAELSDQREQILSNGEQLRTALGGAHERITSDLKTAGETIAQTLNATGDRVTASLGAASDRIVGSLDERGAATVDLLARQGDEIHMRFAAVGDDVVERMSGATRASADNLLLQFADVEAQLRDTGRSLVAEFVTHSTGVSERIGASGAEAIEALRGQSFALAVELASSAEAATETLTSHTRDIAQQIDLRSNDAILAIGQRTEALATRFEDATRDLEQRFEGQTRGLVERAEAVRASIAETLLATETTLETRAEAALDKWRETSSAATERFAAVASEAVAAIEQHGDGLGDRLAASIQSFEHKAHGALEQIDGTSLSATDRIVTAAAEASAVISLSVEGLNDRVAESATGFESQANTILTRWNSVAAATTEAFSLTAGEAVAAINSKGEGLGGELLARATEFEARALDAMSRVTDAAHAGSQAFAASALDAIAAIGAHSDRASGEFATRATEFETRAFDAVARVTESSEAGSRALSLSAAEAADAIGAHSDRASGEFAARATEFETRAFDAAERVAESAQAGARALSLSVSEAAVAIGAHSDRVGGALIARTTEFETRAFDAVARVTEAAHSASQTLSTAASDAVMEIGAHSDRIGGEFAARATDLETRAFDAVSRVTEASQAGSQSLTNSASETIAAIALHSAQVGQEFAARGDEFELRGRALMSDVSRAVAGVIERVELASGDASASITAGGDAVAQQIATRTQELEEQTHRSLGQWTETTNVAAERVASAAGEAVAAISISGDSLHEIVSSRISAFEDTLGQRGGELANLLGEQTRRMDDQLQRLAALVGDGGESFVERIGTRAKEIDDALGRQAETIDAALGGRRDELDQRLDGHRGRFEDLVRKHAEEIELSSSEHVVKLDQTLNTHRGRFEELVRRHADEIEFSSSDREVKLDQTLNAHQRNIEAAFGGALSGLEGAITTRGREAADQIEAEVRAFVSQIGDRLAALEISLTTSGSEIEHRLAARAEAFSAAIGSGIEATEVKSSERLRHISAALESLADRIDQNLEQRGKAVVEALARNTIEATRALSEGGGEISRTLDDKTRTVVDVINAKSTEISDTLQARVVSISNTLDAFAGDMNTRLVSRLEGVTEELSGRARMFESEIIVPLRSLSVQFETDQRGDDVGDRRSASPHRGRGRVTPGRVRDARGQSSRDARAPDRRASAIDHRRLHAGV